MKVDQGSDPSPTCPCGALRADGEPCRARARPGREWCTFHDPELAETRAKARRRGGQRTRERWRARLAEAEKRQGPFAGILTALLDAAGELRKPGMPPEEVQRLRGCVYALSVAARVLEVSELDDKLEQLNERLDGAVGGTWPRAVGGYGDET